MSLAALAGAFLAFAGCSMDYRVTQAEEKTAEGVPDTVATGIVHKIYKNGHLSLVLEASRAETFNSQKKTVLSNARFEELDDKGAMATEGRAGTIVYHTDTENAEISGSVSVHSASEKAVVSARSLAWANKEKKLSAPPAETVVVKKDDGSFIQGTGFVGDFRIREITFSGRVEGNYVWKEKK
ncbi:MAG TPA: LPS export ABC transporter periplasmic protein LptC [Spirochaetia bacterium]|nr:LPS export ABC transporter periplasmic protein LptC [Spirochaetia bacterium]